MDLSDVEPHQNGQHGRNHAVQHDCIVILYIGSIATDHASRLYPIHYKNDIPKSISYHFLKYELIKGIVFVDSHFR